MKLKANPTDTPVGAPSSPMQEYNLAMIRWRHLCESLIFAAPYSTSEYLSHLEATGGRFNRENATRRCKELAQALEDCYPNERSPLKRCHAAVANPIFLDRYAHLLPLQPRRPGMLRRDPVSEAERMARAEETAASL